MNHDKLPPYKLNVKARNSIIVLINLSTITVRVMEQKYSRYKNLKKYRGLTDTEAVTATVLCDIRF
jgi:hypothetical protein